MWTRFTFRDVRIITHYLGVLLIAMSAVMLPSVVTAIVFQEWNPLTRYIIAIGVSFAAGSVLSLAYIRPEKLTRQQALGVTALAWIVLSLVAAVPLYLSGHYLNFLDAVFDGVSAFTTTGASLVLDANHLSNADNMMRFMMLFCGGLGIIVVATSLGLFGRGASTALFTGEGRSEHTIPNIVLATRFILKVSIVIVAITTAVLFILMLADGLSIPRAFLHSFWLAISSYVTGGIAPMTDSIMYYTSVAIEVVCMIVMLLGSLSYFLFYWILKGHIQMYFQDIEIKTAVIWLVVMTAVFTASSVGSQYFDTLPALLHRGAFTIISAFTTTGLAVLTQSQYTVVFSSGAFLVIALIMAVGGSAGSTSGGIKLRRLGIIGKSILLSIKEAVSPETARLTMTYYHNGKHVLEPEIVKNAMTIFVLYVLSYVIGTLAGIAHGYEASMAMFEAVAITSNTGITCGLVSIGMPVSLEVVYIILMWAGRLEFIGLIAFIAQIIASLNPRHRVLVKDRKTAGPTK